jgi:uncharacterized membrane protein AbrB (regulator of aidB expression)
MRTFWLCVGTLALILIEPGTLVSTVVFVPLVSILELGAAACSPKTVTGDVTLLPVHCAGARAGINRLSIANSTAEKIAQRVRLPAVGFLCAVLITPVSDVSTWSLKHQSKAFGIKFDFVFLLSDCVELTKMDEAVDGGKERVGK